MISQLFISKQSISSLFCLFSAESCVDGIQNQGEDGIDCGGPCPTCGK